DDLHGDAGNDVLDGGAGINTLDGGVDDDTLIVRTGATYATGGSGVDTFVLRTDSPPFAANRDAEIEDFEHTDRLNLAALHISNLTDLQRLFQINPRVLTIGSNGYTENIYFGGAFDLSWLTTANVVFDTSTAARTLVGTGNDDNLIGGAGNDKLTGGDG